MLRQIVTLNCKAHLGTTHALFHLWQQLELQRQRAPGERIYVLVADCGRHGGEPCAVWAVVETANGEERVTLRLPDEELLTSTTSTV